MMADIDELRQRAAAFMRQPAPDAAALETPPPRFTPFRIESSIRARELTDRLIALAEGEGEEAGLQAALDEADRAAQAEGLDLAKFALLAFSIHHPRGRRLPVESLEQRAPEKVLPSAGPAAAAEDPESRLSWYREDPKANEHHEHWHVVYRTSGIPGTNPPRAKDRQGEPFFYMHQQMLARYDTDRIAVQLERVKRLDDYGVPIEEGYDPTPLNPVFGDVPYSPRQPGLTMADLDRADFGPPPLRYAVAQHRTIAQRVLDAAQRPSLEKPDGTTVAVDADVLGDIEEPSVDSVDLRFFGNHHGMGHLLLACIDDPTGATPPGVMIDPATAIRDPVFYRWHKHVDDIGSGWLGRQAPHDFSDGPDVVIREGTQPNASPDVILCFKDAIPGSANPGFDGAAFGEQAFGGANWSAPPPDGLTTDELQTMMLQRAIPLPGDSTVDVTYLDQREFVYFLRVENRRPQAQRVTVRIFLVAHDFADDRQMWIELDKFQHTLPTSGRTVVYRPAALSSVIRKPAVKPPGPLADPSPDPDDEENYCDCGWPYNLLLPRGTRDGMAFRLLVMLTDWTKDEVPGDTHCGSMSFCGAKDRYPDRRGMGYPFDRPFPAGRSIAQTIAARDNMATRDVTIRWVDP